MSSGKKYLIPNDSIQLNETRVWKRKINDLRAIQRKIDWAKKIQDKWHTKWKELIEELKPFGSVWKKSAIKPDFNYLGYALNCSPSMLGNCSPGMFNKSNQWGISTNWLIDNEENRILTTPNKNLPLLIGTFSPEGEKLLDQRIRGKVKGIEERPDLINRYDTIEKHLHRLGRFIRINKLIILEYLYIKHHGKIYEDPSHDYLIELIISDKKYIYVQESGGRNILHSLTKLYTPDTYTIKETL